MWKRPCIIDAWDGKFPFDRALNPHQSRCTIGSRVTRHCHWDRYPHVASMSSFSDADGSNLISKIHPVTAKHTHDDGMGVADSQRGQTVSAQRSGQVNQGSRRQSRKRTPSSHYAHDGSPETSGTNATQASPRDLGENLLPPGQVDEFRIDSLSRSSSTSEHTPLQFIDKGTSTTGSIYSESFQDSSM